MIVLIPAYEPGPRLEPIVAGLLDTDAALEVVVIDDGSGPCFADTFDRLETLDVTVLRHAENRGKGAALKTGLDYVMTMHPGDDVVTADADGQHTVPDILRVADAMREDTGAPPTMVLGCRSFTGRVPVRSRAGNALARRMFRLAAGWNLTDTQTGLRGLPSPLIPWVRDQPGERFEFEQNVLLRCRPDGVPVREVPIETVYLHDNASSHFRPIVDSARVALPLMVFAVSSLLAFALDTIALLLLNALTGFLIPSIVAARVLSASVNFALNRRWVFRASTGSRTGRRGRPGEALRYALLAVGLLSSNVVWLEALTGFGIPLLPAKIATEAVLFVTSYGVQRSFVFRAAAGERGFIPAPDARHSNHKGTPTRMESNTSSPRRNP